jgi:hypothetical protein
MKKVFLVALLSIGILFTGSSLFAGPPEQKGMTVPTPGVTPMVAAKDPSRSAKMKVLIDVESGKIEVYKVQGEKEISVKPISLKELKLNGKNIISIPDYTVIRTHSSPGCVTYYYYGYAYQVCN